VGNRVCRKQAEEKICLGVVQRREYVQSFRSVLQFQIQQENELHVCCELANVGCDVCQDRWRLEASCTYTNVVLLAKLGA
jgi:hypothetical protein